MTKSHSPNGQRPTTDAQATIPDNFSELPSDQQRDLYVNMLQHMMDSPQPHTVTQRQHGRPYLRAIGDQRRPIADALLSLGLVPPNVPARLPFRLEVAERFGFVCAGCDLDVRDKAWHIDHHKAYSKGGNLTTDNAVLLCPTCNVRKSNKSPQDFYESGKLAKIEGILNESRHRL